MEKILKYNEDILDYLLEFKRNHTAFTFSLRKRDSPQAKMVKRLEMGQWFQGSNYIFVPLFKKGDNARKIKSIGFNISFNKDGSTNNYIEISFKSDVFTQDELDFHIELCKFLGIKVDKYNVGAYYFKSLNIIENLNYYITEFRDEAIRLLKKYNIEDKYLIKEKDFQKDLQRIEQIKNKNANLLTISKTTPLTMNNKLKYSLNQILYGPPGTGKTYKLQSEYFDLFTIQETALSREQYLKNIIQDLSWWQLITIVLLDIKKGKVRDIYEHELIKVKESLSSSKTVMPTIWGQLQAHTVIECKNVNVVRRLEPLYFWKDDVSFWTINEELLKDNYPQAFEILESVKNFLPIKGKLVKNYEFVTFHQSFSYEDFIEGIKPDIYNESSPELNYIIEDGIFKTICRRAENDPSNIYGLFIDEINRGNVSAIFGELITLIEESKRKPVKDEDKEKCKETIEITLPYSKQKFSVPSNLYIIGTMNTADRSVEALDTALRRRFAFTEMMPRPELLAKTEIEGINLQDLLTIINRRIITLLDSDHQIGHSYLINVKDHGGLVTAFNDCIIPLLKEYFYHDEEKIALVLGEGFVQLENPSGELLDLFPKLSFPNLRLPNGKSHYIFKNLEEAEIVNALKQLIAKNE